MIYPFTAPPEFFTSTYVPHICLVNGTRDNIRFRPVPLRGALLFDMPAIPLPLSPRACRQRGPWRDVLLVLALALWWYILDRILAVFLPNQMAWTWGLGLTGMALAALLAYCLDPARLPWRRPQMDWVESHGQQRVQILFPAGWEKVFLEFEIALKAWQLRPVDEAAAPPPPDEDPLESASAQDDFPDTQGTDWDEAKGP